MAPWAAAGGHSQGPAGLKALADTSALFLRLWARVRGRRAFPAQMPFPALPWQPGPRAKLCKTAGLQRRATRRARAATQLRPGPLQPRRQEPAQLESPPLEFFGNTPHTVPHTEGAGIGGVAGAWSPCALGDRSVAMATTLALAGGARLASRQCTHTLAAACAAWRRRADTSSREVGGGNQ